MFADAEEESSSSGGGGGGAVGAGPAPAVDEVMWEYKWEEGEEAEIHGPFSSQQMAEWAESG